LEGGIEEAAFLRAAAVVKGVYVVSEEQIGASMATLWRALGLRVEGSAAVSLAPVLNRSIKEKKGDLVVVLTGRNAEDGVFRRVVDGLCPW
jgi:threonine dehydratase